MALQVQPQWDLGSSIFSTGDKLVGLMKAATIDDVQPAAVFAAEAIGSQIMVDPHLIGRAIDALGGTQSYRLQTLKLQIGYSAGGIPSQIRQSTPAIKTFILVTALRLHLPAKDIGDLLYEILIENGEIENTPISIGQLTSFVGSIEGHCLAMKEQEAIVNNVFSPIIEGLAATTQNLQGLFLAITPDEGAKILLSIFRALNDQDVRCLHVRGSDAGIWLASILCWLCPEDVNVLDAQNSKLWGRLHTKVSIILDDRRRNWTLEYWHGIEAVSSLIKVEPSENYDRFLLPPVFPQKMLYSMIRTYDPQASHAEMAIVGNLCLGLIQVVLLRGLLTRDLEEGLEPQSIPFRNICPSTFQEDFEHLLQDYGWPSSAIDYACVTSIADHVISNRYYISYLKRIEIIKSVDRKMHGEIFKGIDDESKITDIIDEALGIAERILLRVTNPTAKGFETTPGGRHLKARFYSRILQHLLGNESGLSALFFLRQSLACQDLAYQDTMTTNGGYEKRPPHLLAVCDRGYVSYFRGMIAPPRSPIEAFEIITQPGSLKWREVRQKFLYESRERSAFTTSPNFAVYRISEALDSLRISNSERAQFAIHSRDDEASIQLQCSEPSTGDKDCRISNALVNWALATRVKRTNQDKVDQIAACAKTGINELNLKAPGWDILGCHPRFGDHIEAMASYSGDEMADFLRFGTFDVENLNCIIQGMASIYECVCCAAKQYRNRWIIMATPLGREL